MKNFTFPSGVKIRASADLRVSEKGCLVPCPGPAAVPLPVGFSPVAVVSGITVARNGAEIASVSGGAVTSSAILAAEPEDVFSVGGRLVAMLPDGRKTFIDIDPATGALTVTPDNEVAQPPSLEAESAGLCSADIEAVDLSKKWQESRLLTQSDLSDISRAIRNAVAEVDSRARRLGLLIHPVMALVRLRDKDLHIVYESAPQLFRVAPGDSLPMTVRLTENPTLGATAPLTLTSAAYRLRLSVPAATAQKFASGTVEVVLSPEMPLFDPAGRPHVSGRQRAGQQWICSAAIPVAEGIADDDISLLDTDRLARLAANSDSWAPACSIRLSGESITRTLSLSVRRSVTASDLKLTAPALPYPAFPHLFTAKAAAAGDNVCLWGAPTVRRALPGSVSQLTASTSDTAVPWHGYVAVEMADGSRIVSQETATAPFPTHLRPMISYPAPDAVSLTIGWWCPSIGHYSATLPLVADPAGKRSVYISPTGLQVAATRVGSAFAVPEAQFAPLHYPGLLVATPPDEPTRPIAVGELPAGQLLGLFPAAARQSAWDYGRSRFFAFTTAGVFSVNVDPRRGSMSVSEIDRRGFSDSSAIAPVPGGVVAVHQGSLLLYSASGVRQPATGLGGRHPIWCPENGGEIWLPGADDTLIMSADGSKVIATLSAKFTVSGLSGFIKSVAAGSFHLPAHNSPAGMVFVNLECVAHPPCRPAGLLRHLSFDARGFFNGVDITVRSSYAGVPRISQDLGITLNGLFSRNLSRSFRATTASEYLIQVSGFISTDSEINNIRLW